MSNLTPYAPTVPSGPTSTRFSKEALAGLSIPELQRKKDALEAEIRALGGILRSHGVDMNTPLVTPDGFPRADIDVVQIRTTRARIIHLRNDWKDLMDVIEKRLHEHFASIKDDDEEEAPASAAAQPAAPATSDIVAPRDSISDKLDKPFAKVNSVVENSPAAAAGLRPGDLIRNFGYVNYENHDNLKKVAECVQGNEGQPILVRVSRNTGASRPEEVRLTLTPRRDWGGRGMLGCHILPL